MTFLDDIFLNIHRGCPSGVLFLDLSKAFVTVDHNIMLDNLCEHGLKWSAVSWICSYLSDRVHVTKINGVMSGERRIQCGVPQGSILGPLLFTIYINDLSKHVTLGNTYLYADDTAVVISSDNPDIMSNMLCQTMHELDVWFSSNKLSLNVSKSKLMLFGTQQQLCNLDTVNVIHRGTELEKCTKYKYLGIFLDSTYF